MEIVKLLNCNLRIKYYLFFKCNYNKYFCIFFIYIKYCLIFNIISLGIGDWGLGPIPNPQSPIYLIISINIYLI